MISDIFIDRPRLAFVVSIVITLAGILAIPAIPVAQGADANCRCVSGNDIFGGMRRATGGADDPGGPGAEQDMGQVRRRSGRLPAIRCCANISRGGRR
jgi:hypothetical protein